MLEGTKVRQGYGLRALALGVILAAMAVSMFALPAVASAKAEKAVWLCRPHKTPDPCEESRATTVVTYTGDERHETTETPGKAKPPIDCFYVYPTVSEQEGPNANLTIEPQETAVAVAQASRFSSVCKVYAPMYPQLTLKAIKEKVPPEAGVKAYLGVAKAFHEYLTKFNKGRGIVLIGHSQGSIMLENLIHMELDPNPELREKLVSAIILGGNVLVPEGMSEGVTFEHEPLCASAAETGCVIAYSTFLQEPPENAFFGRPESPLLTTPPPPGSEVACVNPTLLVQNGGTGTLIPYAPTTPFPGEQGKFLPTPKASTPWVRTQGIYQAQCHKENGATWLEPSFKPSVTEKAKEQLATDNEVAVETIGPEWGLHLYDVNIAVGNLVNTVAIQSAAYGAEH
jgi:hypothetical protein